MIYNVTGEFVKITETSGTIQNTSNIYTVEISDKAEVNSGIFLYPLNKFSFADKTFFARCIDANAQAEIRVSPFTVDMGGSGSSGGTSTPVNIATDEQVNDILDDIFPLP